MELWNYIRGIMLKNPDQIVCEGKVKMTYEEIVIYAELFAKKLEGEKSCAILCGCEMTGAISLLSCFAAGITAVPLSVRYGQAHSGKILDRIDPTSIISDIDGELKVFRISNSAYKEPKDHPALIMCTSGTTGKPKGVMLSEKNVLSNVNAISRYFCIDKSDSILISRPLYHCAVITGEFLLALLKGMKIVFYSDKLNPKVLLDIISENGITVFCGTPTILEMIARYKKSDASCPLEKICVSGERLSAKTAAILADTFSNADIYHVYGLTEASPRVSYLPPRLFRQFPQSVGYPLDSVNVKVVKEDGSIANEGEEGVLWVNGKNVMLGYYNDPQLTGKVMKDGWLCTGDIATIDSNGLLSIKGRSDDLIIRAGMNIYPQDVESTLKTDSRVREVLVYKIDSSLFGVQLGLRISGDFANIDEVKKLCMSVLPSFQRPSKIELMDELPKNGSGKIIRSVIDA